MRRVLAAVLLAAGLLIGCGSSDDDASKASSQPTVESNTPAGNAATVPETLVGEYETTLDKKDTPDALLQATFFLYIYDDGTLSLVHQGFASVSGTIAVDGGQVTFEMPDMTPCSTSPAATYKWKATSKSLTLTAVDEKCDARQTILSSHPLTRD